MKKDGKIFEIELKSLSPISVTKRIFGALYETFTFIPAWTIWGALAKMFALSDKNSNSINYNGFKEVRLTNFYIYDKEKKDIITNTENARKKFVSSSAKTSIDVLSNTSLEHSLYEREFLFARKFIGWIKVEENGEIYDFIKNNLKDKILFIGADKNTGFGKVRVSNVRENDKSLLEEGKGIFEAIRRSVLPGTRNEASGNSDMLYLIPPEFKKPNVKSAFPLVIRRWSDSDFGYAIGNGMEIIFVDFVNDNMT